MSQEQEADGATIVEEKSGHAGLVIKFDSPSPVSPKAIKKAGSDALPEGMSSNDDPLRIAWCIDPYTPVDYMRPYFKDTDGAYHLLTEKQQRLLFARRLRVAMKNVHTLKKYPVEGKSKVEGRPIFPRFLYEEIIATRATIPPPPPAVTAPATTEDVDSSRRKRKAEKEETANPKSEPEEPAAKKPKSEQPAAPPPPVPVAAPVEEPTEPPGTNDMELLKTKQEVPIPSSVPESAPIAAPAPAVVAAPAPVATVSVLVPAKPAGPKYVPAHTAVMKALIERARDIHTTAFVDLPTLTELEANIDDPVHAMLCRLCYELVELEIQPDVPAPPSTDDMRVKGSSAYYAMMRRALAWKPVPKPAPLHPVPETIMVRNTSYLAYMCNAMPEFDAIDGRIKTEFAGADTFEAMVKAGKKVTGLSTEAVEKALDHFIRGIIKLTQTC